MYIGWTWWAFGRNRLYDCKLNKSNQYTFTKYYTDIDREGHEISHFGGLPRELYFPRDYISHPPPPPPEVHSTEGKYNYLGTTDTWYFIRPGRHLLYKMVKMNDFIKILRLVPFS